MILEELRHEDRHEDADEAGEVADLAREHCSPPCEMISIKRILSALSRYKGEDFTEAKCRR